MLADLVLLALGSSVAHAEPDLTIQSPTLRSEIRITSPIYDDTDRTIVAGGRIDDLPFVNWPPNGWIEVNGHPIQPTPDTPGSFVWSDDVAIGDGAGPYWSATNWRDSGVWMHRWFSDPLRLLKPILVEVLDPVTEQVYARRRTTILDLRLDGDAQASRVNPGNPYGGGAQLSRIGLARLGAPHTDSLPWENRAELEADLAAIVASLPLATHEPADEICVSAAPYPELFLTDAFLVSFLGQYAASYLSFTAGNVTACVRTPDPPLPNEVDVCVGRLQAEVQDIDVGRVDLATLAASATPDTIGSSVTLANVDTEADVWLRDVRLVYNQNRGEMPPCTMRPSAPIGDDTLANDAGLRDWSTCPLQRLDADRAESIGSHTFSVQADPLSTEELLVSSVLRRDYELFGLTTTVDDGMCVLSEFEPEAEAVLLALAPVVGQGLGDGWGAHPPTTDQTEALATLLSPFEVGLDHPFRLDLRADVAHVAVDAADGMQVSWATDAHPVDPFDQALESVGWFYREPDPLPVFPDGIDPYGEPFDLSVVVTPGLLNQVLRAASATRRFRDPLSPSWADLGITPPQGLQDWTDATLDGTNLSTWISVFGRYPDQTFAFRVYPVIDPFVWMPRDPGPGRDNRNWPVTYQLGQYYVDLVATGDRDRVLVRAVADFFDGDLQVGLHGTAGRPWLEVTLGNPDVSWTVMSTVFDRCPMVEHDPARPPGDVLCESFLEGRLDALLTPVLERRMAELLKDVPVPVDFDVQGTVGDDRVVVQRDIWKEDGNIVLFGMLEIP